MGWFDSKTSVSSISQNLPITVDQALYGRANVTPVTVGKTKGKGGVSVSNYVTSDTYETLYQRTVTPTVITQTDSPGARADAEISPSTSGAGAFGLDGKTAAILAVIAFGVVWFMRR